MEYVLLIVVLGFILFIAWREREVTRERAETARLYGRERSELLTRITHPELVVVPDPDPLQSFTRAPDTEAEVDQYGMVGTIVPGVE